MNKYSQTNIFIHISGENYTLYTPFFSGSCALLTIYHWNTVNQKEDKRRKMLACYGYLKRQGKYNLLSSRNKTEEEELALTLVQWLISVAGWKILLHLLLCR
jgi:hypothetical protein